MIENVNKYKFEMADYKEYIEMWIHEIKLPVATTKLIIENNRNETTNSIEEETNKIEDYIEQSSILLKGVVSVEKGLSNR